MSQVLRGSRPFSKLAMPTTSAVTQMTTGPASPSASNLVSGMTPSVHQQPGQVYQTQSSQFVGGSIGLQQPPALRLERARPNEVKIYELLSLLGLSKKYKSGKMMSYLF